jgi:molecular chaperone HscB
VSVRFAVSESPIVSTGDPFSVLGLPRRYDLDRVQIERAYLARAAVAHPDHANTSDDPAAPDPGQAAADLNLARETLLNPESRAEALLSLLKGPGKDQDRSLPSGFLMDLMGARESIDAAIQAGDRVGVEAHLTAAAARRDRHIAEVARLFAGVASDRDSLVHIRRELNAWRYIERLIEQVREAFDARVTGQKNISI